MDRYTVVRNAQGKKLWNVMDHEEPFRGQPFFVKKKEAQKHADYMNKKVS